MSLVTGFFLPVLLLNQRWSPPLRLQASHCSTFRIMFHVTSIAVFCSEPIERFSGTDSKFFLKLIVTIPVAPIITGIIVHGRFYIRCISILKLLYFNLSLLYLFSPLCRVFTIIYLKQAVIVFYAVFQLFCIYNCATCNVISLVKCVLYFTSALPAVCVQWPTRLFFLQFLNFVLSRYVAQVLSESFWDGSSRPAITGITFAFTFHMRWIYIEWYLYFKIFSVCFVSAGIATSIDMRVPCLSSRIMMSGLLLGYFCQFALFVPQ